MRLLQVLLVLIILGLQFRLWVGPGSMAEIDRLEDAIVAQQEENETLAACNQELLVEVEELKNGTDAIEEMARHDLGLVGEDETFFMIVEEAGQTEDEGSMSNRIRCE